MAALGFFSAGCFACALTAALSFAAALFAATPFGVLLASGVTFACGFAASVFAFFATAFRATRRCRTTFLTGFATGLDALFSAPGTAMFVVAANCFGAGFMGCGPKGFVVLTTFISAARFTPAAIAAFAAAGVSGGVLAAPC